MSLSDNTEIASFSINGGLFQSEPALIENGDRLQISLGTGSQYATTYRVRVTVGGTDSWFLVTTQGDPTGVTGPSADSAPLLYPSPAHDRLYVRARPGTVLTVANALGRVVKTWTQTASTDEHDVSDLPAGLYLVSIRQACGVETRKVVVR